MSEGPPIDQSRHFQQQADYWREDFWNMFARKEALETALKVLAEKDGLPDDVKAVVSKGLAESNRLAEAQIVVCDKRKGRAIGNEPPAKGGPGSVNLSKVLRPNGEYSLAFQLLNDDGSPLAFLDLTMRETAQLIGQLRGAFVTIWGNRL